LNIYGDNGALTWSRTLAVIMPEHQLIVSVNMYKKLNELAQEVAVVQEMESVDMWRPTCELAGPLKFPKTVHRCPLYYPT